MGYYPVTDAPYDRDYFLKYQGYALTELGREITDYRVSLVEEFYRDGALVDVGIGCGAFVQARGGQTRGYDVNPAGVRWLTARGLWTDPYAEPVPAVTLWDVLEHLPEPQRLLGQVTQLVFTCLPIFRDASHVLASKHFRRDEHCWYWTREGLRAWMSEHGFRCIHEGDRETRLGREDILTFVFRRVG